MDGNRDDASLCLDRANEAFSAGDLPRARRMLSRSKRMYSKGGLASEQSKLDISLTAAERTAARSQQEEPPKRESTPQMDAVVAKVQKAAPQGHYAVLGIERDATDADIKKAFRKLALALHPDKNCADGAEDAFKKASRAFEVLGDPDRRKMYDKFGVDDSAESQMPGSSRAGPSGAAQRRRRARNRPGGYRTLEEELDDLMSNMSSEDVFEFLFSGAGGAGRGGFGRGQGPNFVFQTHQFGGRSHEQHGRPNVTHRQVPRQDDSMFSLWRPVMLLLSLVGFMFIMVATDDRIPFSLRPTPTLTLRRHTNCNIQFFVSPRSNVSPAKSRVLGRLHEEVHREAFVSLSESCRVEQSHHAWLKRKSESYFSSERSREIYRVKAATFASEAFACREVASLSSCLRRDSELEVVGGYNDL